MNSLSERSVSVLPTTEYAGEKLLTDHRQPDRTISSCVASFEPTPEKRSCTCKDCGKVFNSVWYLKQHAVKHSSERPFTCKYCHKTYRFRSNLYQHKCPSRDRASELLHAIRAKKKNAKRRRLTGQQGALDHGSPMTLTTTSVSAVTDFDDFSWPIDRLFDLSSQRGGLSCHGLRDDEVRQFLERHKDQLHQCSKCTMCFPSKEYLARHNAWHVFEEEKVRCPHCSEKFEDELSYGLHKQSHSPSTLHICFRCRGRFCHRLALKRHLVKCCALFPRPSYDPAQFIDRSPPATPLSSFNEHDLSSVSSNGSSGFYQSSRIDELPEHRCGATISSAKPIEAVSLSLDTDDVTLHPADALRSEIRSDTTTTNGLMRQEDSSTAELCLLLDDDRELDFVGGLDLNSSNYSDKIDTGGAGINQNSDTNVNVQVTGFQVSEISLNVADRQTMSLAAANGHSTDVSVIDDALFFAESIVPRSSADFDSLASVRSDIQQFLSPVASTTLLSGSGGAAVLPTEYMNGCNSCTMPGRSWTPDSDSWDSGFSDCSMPCNYQVPLVQEAACMPNGVLSTAVANYGSKKLLNPKAANEVSGPSAVYDVTSENAGGSPGFILWNDAFPIMTNTMNDVFDASPMSSYVNDFSPSSSSSSRSSSIAKDINSAAKEGYHVSFSAAKTPPVMDPRAVFTSASVDRFYDGSVSLTDTLPRSSLEPTTTVSRHSVNPAEKSHVFTVAALSMTVCADTARSSKFQDLERRDFFPCLTNKTSSAASLEVHGDLAIVRATGAAPLSFVDTGHRMNVKQNNGSEPSFACDSCGRDFCSAKSLSVHYFNTHAINPNDANSTKAEEAVAVMAVPFATVRRTEADDQIFLNEDCGRVSSVEASLGGCQQTRCQLPFGQLNNGFFSSSRCSSDVVPQPSVLSSFCSLSSSSSSSTLNDRCDKTPFSGDCRLSVVKSYFSSSDCPKSTTMTSTATTAVLMKETHAQTPECVFIPSLEMTVILPDASVAAGSGGGERPPSSVGDVCCRSDSESGPCGATHGVAGDGVRRIFRCGCCSKTFLLKKYLRRHERMQHQNLAKAGDANGASRSKGSKTRATAPAACLDCPMCPKSFVNMKLLKQHVSFHARADTL